ncbi:hypothetical protein DPMN_042665 [Dreissena polymorpha]|uniref:Uncharacterized protein n=1 Tax=Dreissena polymorpha TaxID=45954 RepID=A0A9D4HX39_DREPO|nr:hypothetical protein DPMN_042665 [Dreissena polymorpha]
MTEIISVDAVHLLGDGKCKAVTENNSADERHLMGESKAVTGIRGEKGNLSECEERLGRHHHVLY